jgi:hypothetical protein
MINGDGLTRTGCTAVCALSLIACSFQAPLPGDNFDETAREHIRQIAQTLPPDSRLRLSLQEGKHGDGVREPWMGTMRREGVRRALVRTEFSLRGRQPADDVKVSRILYFSEYEGNCAQISDPRRLEEIRASGLGEDVGKAAVQRTAQRNVQVVDGLVTALRGVGDQVFFDDEWLPAPHPFLSPSSATKPHPFLQAIDMGDTAFALALVHSGLDPALRDTGIWLALTSDEWCVVTGLLASGVDPNLRDQDGLTLLMEAAKLGTQRSAEALLAAGADARATASLGKTALSFAAGSKDEDMIRLLKNHGARE